MYKYLISEVIALVNVVKRNNITIKGKGEQVLLFAHGFGTAEEEAFEIAQQFVKQFEKTIWPSVGRLKAIELTSSLAF